MTLPPRPLRRPLSVGEPAANPKPRRGVVLNDVRFDDAQVPSADASLQRPANQHILDRADALQKETPVHAAELVSRIRELVLRDIFVRDFAVTVGITDATEVITNAFEPPSDTRYLTAVKNMASAAILADAVFTVRDIFGLTAEAAALYLDTALPRPHIAQADKGQQAQTLNEVMQRILDAIPKSERSPIPAGQRRNKV